MISIEHILLTSANQLNNMALGRLILLITFAAMVIGCVVLTIFAIKTGRIPVLLLIFAYVVAIITMVCSFYCNSIYQKALKSENDIALSTEPSEKIETTIPVQTEPVTEIPTEAETEQETEPTTMPEPELTPAYTENSNPENWDITWDIVPADGSDAYQAPAHIEFGNPEEYYPMPGVTTFRGNNWRSDAAYGTADITNETLTKKWNNKVGSLNGWPGVGWTGQPLLVQWDEETKQLMDLYESKKSKEGLVEVIATTLDGYIYFWDLEDGSKTRDPLWIGMSVKGTATLDPRGIPMLYVGAGLVNESTSTVPKMYIISLLDNSILYSKTAYDNWAHRAWCALDSSPLVSSEADTLIWPCENGLIYSIKLNTQYDKQAGTLSVEPENIAKVRYQTEQNRTKGFESSMVIVDEYAFMGDNGGNFFCVDVNTMELVWAQHIKDDLNATPVFEWGDDQQGYLYLGTSMEYAKENSYEGSSYLYKINATTGEIVWEYAYEDIIYDYDVSGGVLSSPVLGKDGTSLENMVIFSVGKTHDYEGGTLVALHADTGEVIWENKMNKYSWSSPVAVYTSSKTGYLVFANAGGNVYLVNDKGEILSTVNVGSMIEASPSVFNNMIVMPTRGGYVYGIEIS